MTHWSRWLHTLHALIGENKNKKKKQIRIHVCMQPFLRASQWLGLIPQNHNSSKLISNLSLTCSSQQPPFQNRNEISELTWTTFGLQGWWTDKSTDMASQFGVSKCQSTLLRQWNAMSMDLSFIGFHQSIYCKIKMDWFKIHQLALGYMQFWGNLTKIKYKYMLHATNFPWLFIWCI